MFPLYYIACKTCKKNACNADLREKIYFSFGKEREGKWRAYKIPGIITSRPKNACRSSNKLVRVGGSRRIEKSGRLAIRQQAAVACCTRRAVSRLTYRLPRIPEMQEKIQSCSLGRGQV